MRRYPILLLAILALLFAVSGCRQVEYLLCPDGVTQVTDLSQCPEERPACPECDDGNRCTLDQCGPSTNYTCVYSDIAPCDGNGICEEGEYQRSNDCPANCDDGDACTEDFVDYTSGRCTYQEIVPCCGNNKCDSGETFVSCVQDCEQVLDLTVTKYERRQRLEGAGSDLLGSDYTYVLVYFKIENIGIDNPEKLDYQERRGFYYDPFKMRIEDDQGRFYEVEYDTDLIPGYLDYTIIGKGQTKGAALLFIVSLDAEHIRLVAYDKFGAKLDISEIY